MNKITTTIFAAFIVGAFALSACGGDDKKNSGDKCAAAVENTMNLSMETVKSITKKMADDKRKQIVDKAKKDMDARTPNVLKKCKEKLKADPKVENTLDCLIASKDMKAVLACKGAKGVMK